MSYIDNECDRRTGRSTTRRLFALGYACMTPGTEVEFKDHMPNTPEQIRGHASIMRRYAKLLQLPATVFVRDGRIFVLVNMSEEERRTRASDAQRLYARSRECRLDGGCAPKEFKLSAAQCALLKDMRPELAGESPDLVPGLAYRRRYSSDRLRLEFRSLNKTFGVRRGFDRQVDTAAPCIVLGGDEVEFFLYADHMDNVERATGETRIEGDVTCGDIELLFALPATRLEEITRERAQQKHRRKTMEAFEKELEQLINKHSIENVVDMPDFLLAAMICRMIEAMGPSIKKTLDWHGCDSVCHPSPNDRMDCEDSRECGAEIVFPTSTEIEDDIQKETV